MQPLNRVQAASRRQVQDNFRKDMARGRGVRGDKYCYVDIIIGLAHRDGNVAAARRPCAAGKIAEILRVRHPVMPQARYHGRLAALDGGVVPVTRAVA
ncbi:hypothetical protein CSQ94_09840 [Janthinobacterium sp. BJB312]|nr:hypothetical protein CSQ94_09840 [Janthinobacterium sp. BJB312]